MNTFYRAFSFVLLSLAMTGCISDAPKEAYSNHGQPESLISVSSERVVFGVSDSNSVDSIAEWMEDDVPSAVEITCTSDNDVCASVKDMFISGGIPYNISESTDGTSKVALVYHRLTAQDCDNTFVSNHINHNNLNHPAFGCSAAVNIVQMVPNRVVFIQPPLAADANADSAARAYDTVHARVYPF